MQILPFIRDCVVFLYASTKDGLRPAGTAFAVSLQYDGTLDNSYEYLVSAKHVVEGIAGSSDDQHVYARVNFLGGAQFVDIGEATSWIFHEDPAVDLAVLDWEMPAGAQVLPYPLSIGAATPDVIAREGIGLGDDVFVTGLFRKRLGQSRNTPIVRVGNIVAMPGEPIRTKTGPQDAYLIELRSTGGLSGSPVFVYIGGMRRVVGADGKFTLTPKGGASYLLGVMHGHWDLDQDDSVVSSSPTNEDLNTGIAIVVPVSKLFDVLNRDDISDTRARALEALRGAPPATDGG